MNHTAPKPHRMIVKQKLEQNVVIMSVLKVNTILFMIDSELIVVQKIF